MTNRGRSILLLLCLVGFAVIVGGVVGLSKYPDHSSSKAYKKQGIMSPVQIELQDWTQSENGWVEIDYVVTNNGNEIVAGWTMLYMYGYLNTQGKQVMEREEYSKMWDRCIMPKGQYYGSFFWTEHREIVRIKIWGVTDIILE